MLTGETEATAGTVWKHPNLRIAYVAQVSNDGGWLGARGVGYTAARWGSRACSRAGAQKKTPPPEARRPSLAFKQLQTNALALPPPPALCRAIDCRAQHAFHHLESHLDKTPNEYIQVRGAPPKGPIGEWGEGGQQTAAARQPWVLRVCKGRQLVAGAHTQGAGGVVAAGAARVLPCGGPAGVDKLRGGCVGIGQHATDSQPVLGLGGDVEIAIEFQIPISSPP